MNLLHTHKEMNQTHTARKKRKQRKAKKKQQQQGAKTNINLKLGIACHLWNFEVEADCNIMDIFTPTGGIKGAA